MATVNEQIKLKFGSLVIVKRDNLWVLKDGYRPDGSFTYERESNNLDEIAIGFSDILSLRIRDWVKSTLEKEREDVQKIDHIKKIIGKD